MTLINFVCRWMGQAICDFAFSFSKWAVPRDLAANWKFLFWAHRWKNSFNQTKLLTYFSIFDHYRIFPRIQGVCAKFYVTFQWISTEFYSKKIKDRNYWILFQHNNRDISMQQWKIEGKSYLFYDNPSHKMAWLDFSLSNCYLPQFMINQI